MHRASSPRYSARQLLLPLALASALLLGACKEEEQSQQPPPMPVTVVTLQTETVNLGRELSGRAAPSLIAEVRPQVSGIIQRRLFTEGSLVRAGQPLYQLDDASYRADAGSAQANLARAEAALASARLTAQRSAELASIDAVSQQDNDNAQAALQQAQADVRAARASVQGTQVTVGRARITSPISGRIGRSSVTQGALVTAAQAAPLATVQQLDPMYVDVNQSASEYLQMRRAFEDGSLQSVNVPVSITLEDGSAYPYDGKLAFSEVSVDPTTGSYALRIEVPNPQHLLLPGMYVRAHLVIGEKKDGILAPQQGISRDASGATVALVVNADNVVEARPVVVSQAIGDKWLVESGLNAGDRIIIAGLQKTGPGATVNPQEAGSMPNAQQNENAPAADAAQSTPAAANTAPAAAHADSDKPADGAAQSASQAAQQ